MSVSGKLPRPDQLAGAVGSGKVIAGRYRIQRLIAHGGMGVVYLAEHIELGRLVALKILKHQHDPDNAGAFQERFTLEARTLGSLDHPNIVTLYDYGRTEDSRFFLALEFIDGPRFTDIIREGRLEPERAVRLILQVCRALRYSHRRGVIHRDLKPSNLLIHTDDEGRENVKVVDFGLVKVLEDDQSLTQAGLILGSPHCMSPEQVKGLSVDERTDIYAIGVLLFRTVTGTWPFHGESSTATMIAHINEPIPSFAVAGDLMVPPGLEEIVYRCLAKEPEERYPEVGSLMQDLQVCLGISPNEYHSTTQMSAASLHSHHALPNLAPPPPQKQSNRSLLILALLVLVMLLGSGGWVISQMVLSRDTETTTVVPPEPDQPAEIVLDPPVEVPAEVLPEEALPAEEPPNEEPPVEVVPEEIAAPAVVQNPRPRPRPVETPTPSETASNDQGSGSDSSNIPEEKPEDDGGTPDGYMGLPDDFDF
ncbi:MAG: serine/threonine protein kinase [Myxococcota bacterium]|jgi:serine/threonine protein kinase